MADENEVIPEVTPEAAPSDEPQIDVAIQDEKAPEPESGQKESEPAQDIDVQAVVEAISKSAANPFAVSKPVFAALQAAGEAGVVGDTARLTSTGRLLQIV